MLGSISAYTHIKHLNELINLKPGEFQTYNIFLNDMDEIDGQASLLYKALANVSPVVPREEDLSESGEEKQESPGRRMHGMFGMMSGGNEDEEPWEGTKYSLTTLNDMMSEVMAMVDVLNAVGFVVFLVLLLIIMVGITNTFRMILIERTREIVNAIHPGKELLLNF